CRSFVLMLLSPLRPSLFPYTTLFRSRKPHVPERTAARRQDRPVRFGDRVPGDAVSVLDRQLLDDLAGVVVESFHHLDDDEVLLQDRKSTRLNSSHLPNSHAPFFLSTT